ncbi:diphthine synthase [Candidatus Woesearchaeota archaeon]|nr:diphthine synthase [Candidatus Woesearchaeota archaeon]
MITMLYLIGLGLKEDDLPLRAVDILENCDSIYYETFTSAWMGDIEKIADTAGKDIELLPREKVESDFLVNEAKKKNVVLLVPGDPLTATTHIQLVMDAKKSGVPFEILHAPSIFTAIAETGLQLYKFGRTTTLPAPQNNYKPSSQFDVIRENMKSKLHTLVLLDIGMTAKEGLKILAENGFADTFAVACCRLGTKERKIKPGKVSELAARKELSQAPAAIVIAGELNFKEEEAMKLWE